MDSSKLGQNEGPKHHHRHHHHFHVSPECPFHRSILRPVNHSPSCSFSNLILSPNPQPYNNTSILPNASEPLGEITEQELEGDEDVVLVLTDEWREFFAKSEAKRRLAKKKQVKNKKC